VSFESLTDKPKTLAFFKEYFPDAEPFIENLTEDFFKNPTSALVTMKCYPWSYWDKVALVGDSAHAIVPFYGQGMNAGFEDIFVLNTLMDSYGDDWEKIFSEYQKSRKPNADAIAELSYRNFMEMSSKTADPKFLLQKKIEKHFAKKHPDLWVPLYSRVTFSDRPYAEALKIGDRQEKIMAQIMATPDIENNWDQPFVLKKIKELLAIEA
jgi:kynurenine 3-monooxygenase